MINLKFLTSILVELWRVVAVTLVSGPYIIMTPPHVTDHPSTLPMDDTGTYISSMNDYDLLNPSVPYTLNLKYPGSSAAFPSLFKSLKHSLPI